MSKLRIYQLAKELNVSNKELIDQLTSMGIEAYNHMSSVEDEVANKLKRAMAAFEAQAKLQKQKKEEQKPAETKPVVPQAETKQPQAKSVETKAAHRNDQQTKPQGQPSGHSPQSKQPAKQAHQPHQRNEAKHINKAQQPHQKDANKQQSSDAKKPVAHASSHASKTTTGSQTQGQKKEYPKKDFVKKDYPKKDFVKKDYPSKDQKPRTQGQPAPAPIVESAEVVKDRPTRRPGKKTTDKREKEDKVVEKKPRAPFRKFDGTKKKRGKKSDYKKPTDDVEEVVEVEDLNIYLPARTTVGEFANAIDKPNNEIILKLMNLGVMAAVNHYIDFETMNLIASEFNIEIIQEEEQIDEDILAYDFDDKKEDLKRRAPVVTVMGHVDHGKTSLLDAIRSTSVTSREAGGITQHIGASEVRINGERIVFLDTPGHEAFTSLRARGAQVTDIAILVVAADDGVMPQTIEAIDHARAANVPIIVAVNKIDKPNANPDAVKKELAEHGVLVEEWGGEVVSVPVSALNGQNIDTLLEMVLLVSEMLELKANPERNAIGTVIEANLDKGRGAVATVLIQNGTLKVGDPFVCGTTYGRVRAMFNDKGKKIKQSGPSTAVEVIGMSEVAMAGDKFVSVDGDREARVIAEKRFAQLKEDRMNRHNYNVSLEDWFSQVQAGSVKELNLIIKADVHGSLEAIKHSLLKLSNEEVKVNIQHANIGPITESDIMLATASHTIVLGFNVRPTSAVLAMAKNEGVEIKTYRIIYELINDVTAAMTGMLDPIFEEVSLGEVQVRATFKVPNVGTIAGAYVLSGKVTRNAKVRVLRDGIIIHDGEISSLKRFKDDAKEVLTNFECGISIAGFNDLKENDIIEAYIIEEIKRK